jgi:16S rRNA processing protein RimM
MSANRRSRQKNSGATSPGANSAASANDTPGAAWIAIGEVVGAFGIRGEVKIFPLTDFPDRFAQTPTLYLGDAHTPYTVKSARLHQRVVIVTVDGIDDMAAAQHLRGATVWIPEDERMPLDQDQFYLHDVVGLRVVHVNGQPLGEVVDFMTGSGNDLFVVRAVPSGREVLLPAVRAFVRELDVAGRVLRVDPIPGLFDEQSENAGDSDSPNALVPAEDDDE